MMATQQSKMEAKRVFRSNEGRLVTIVQAKDANDVERIIRETFDSTSDIKWTVKPPRKSPYADSAEVVLLGKALDGTSDRIVSILTQLQ